MKNSILIFLFLLPYPTWSQQVLVDSLSQLLKFEKAPIQQIDLHFGLSRAYNSIGDNLAIKKHLQAAAQLSQKNNYQKGNAIVLLLEGVMGYGNGEGAEIGYEKSLKALSIAQSKAKHSQKVLDVNGGKITRGKDIIQYTNGRQNNQQFQFIRKGDYYQIRPKTNKNLFFDVEGGSKSGGARILLWSETGNDNQLFKLTHMGNGYFRISPKSNPQMALDIKASSKNNAASLVQWNYGGGANQLFRLLEMPN